MNKALLIPTALATILATCCSVAGQDGQPSVEPAARDYRIAIYNRFRLERDQYDLLREAGDELLKTWRDAGSPEASVEEVVLWYGGATRAALAGSREPLPPTPYIEPAVVREAPAEPVQESYTPVTGAKTIEAPEGTAPAADAAADASATSMDFPALDAPASLDSQTPQPRILSSMAKAVLRSVSLSQ